MKKLFLIFALIFSSISLQAQQSRFRVSGVYIGSKDDDDKTAFLGAKASYESLISPTTTWAIFIGYQAGSNELSYTAFNGMYTQTFTGELKYSLFSVGAQVNHYLNQNIFFGSELMYSKLSVEASLAGESDSDSEDGFGWAPLLGVEFGSPETRFFIQGKYLMISLGDQNTGFNRLSFEAGVAFKL
jgi:hypothetical protein